MNASSDELAVAIVVAAGSGRRLGRDLPKAAVEVAGWPMVVRSVRAMFLGGVEQVVVVAPTDQQQAFASMFANQADRVQVVTGGLLRQDSVRLGLASAPDATTVLVHDAARPLVPPFLVTMVLAAVRDGADVVVPVLPVTDSLRRLRRDGSSPVDRSDFVRVQTPQGFKADLLRQAHLAIGDREYSDDASLCESIGAHVQTVPGDPLAFKITEPLDLKLAETVVRGEA